jgi:hypothetical protein
MELQMSPGIYVHVFFIVPSDRFIQTPLCQAIARVSNALRKMDQAEQTQLQPTSGSTSSLCNMGPIIVWTEGFAMASLSKCFGFGCKPCFREPLCHPSTRSSLCQCPDLGNSTFAHAFGRIIDKVRMVARYRG